VFLDSIDDFRAKGLKIIGCAGVLNKRKGFDQILHLIAVEKNMALVILGSGKEITGLIRLSEKLKIQERCLFTGFKENAVSCYQAFDFFAVPSRSEGFGLALIEAVEQRVPVICSDIEVFKELFNDSEVTFFHLEDLVSLSGALKDSVEYGREKADRAYARYKSKYTVAKMAECCYELYQAGYLVAE
jgi:glycosyltransferase involved in cell wall biosynthesis